MSECPFTIDFETSTVLIAGERLPAVEVICPPHSDFPDDTETDRSMGLRIDGRITEVYVPTENGLITELGWTHDTSLIGRNGSLRLHIHSPRCEEDTDPADRKRTWLPRTMVINPDGVIRPWRVRRGGSWYWERCEPEWAVEQLHRISRCHVEDPDTGTPTVKLVSLDWLREQHASSAQG